MRGVAAVTNGSGFDVAEVEIGAPAPGEVLVSIDAAGICHTDFDLVRTSPSGVILGHEGAGTIAALGDGIDDLRVGDRVLLTWAISCGECFQCSLGNEVLCERFGAGPGGHAHAEATTRNGDALRRAFNLGTLSSATVVRREAVVALRSSMPFASACVLGCGVMTGYGSVVNVARVAPGSSVVVIGCGGVGLNVVQAARIAGAAFIVAVDPAQERLTFARRLGATHAVLAARDDVMLTAATRSVRGIVGERGADYAFECTGVPELCASPLAFVRNGGTAVQVSGTEQDVTIDMRLFEWDKTYINPLYGQCRPRVDFPRLIALYEQGELLLDELVGKTYVLDELRPAFDDMLAGRIAKGVVVFE